MTPEDRKLCAKFEAHLRGDDFFVMTWMNRPGSWKLLHKSGSETTPTPPDTADGREWWAEALTIESLWTPESKQWSAEVGWNDLGYCWFDRSRSEAITAAIVAAAKAWAG